MNPMLSRLTQNSPVPAQQPSNNPMIQQFAEFKRQFAGKDPKDIAQQMLQFGLMTQQQFDQFMQLQSMLR